MKTASDPRHKKRQKTVQLLFSYSYNPAKKPAKLLAEILPNLTQIDNLIVKAAPQFPAAKLNKIDLAILRLAVFELVIEKVQPPKVIIDEAVELGKEFGSENSPKFINGVLGSIIKQ